MSARKNTARRKRTRPEKRIAEEQHVQGLIIRGEVVVQASPGEPPPPGVTHVVVKGRKDGKPAVKRVRFSMR